MKERLREIINKMKQNGKWRENFWVVRDKWKIVDQMKIN